MRVDALAGRCSSKEVGMNGKTARASRKFDQAALAALHAVVSAARDGERAFFSVPSGRAAEIGPDRRVLRAETHAALECEDLTIGYARELLRMWVL
jgi:hypothetical protein